MTDDDLIRRAKIAWHNNKTDYIALPIFSTNGTQLLDIAFYKNGNEWVGTLQHESMVELVRTAEVLRQEPQTATFKHQAYGFDTDKGGFYSEEKKEWVGLTDIEIHILKMQYDKVKVAYTDTAKNLSVLGQDVNVDGLISAIESKLKEKNNAT